MKCKQFLTFKVMFLLISGLTTGCLEREFVSPPGYNFAEPEKFNMPSSLLEISGITFLKGNSDTVFSIQDEDGRVFKQKWGIKKQRHTKFAKNGDFEDIGILNDQIFALKSDGKIYAFPISEIQGKKTKLTQEHSDVLPEGEYEGMYSDAVTNTLYVLCKKCFNDKKSKRVTGYVLSYDPVQRKLTNNGEFSIDYGVLAEMGVKLKGRPAPSAIARHPATKDWYILSSANKLLVITDTMWHIKAGYRLNSSMFNQPEGIAFDSSSNLFISNEGDELSDGNILKFSTNK